MDPVLSASLAPGIALIISVVTYVVTDRRAADRETRTAAKDTVDILAAQNEAQAREILALKERVDNLEVLFKECVEGRTRLEAELLEIRTKLTSVALEKLNEKGPKGEPGPMGPSGGV